MDIGCGNGKIANYINVETSAKVDGIDFSEHAINCAKELSNKDLRFNVQDINELNLSKDVYSVIYSIDSLYFSNDYTRTLELLYESLKPKGRLGSYYSEFVFEKEKQIHRIEKDETKIAYIVNGERNGIIKFLILLMNILH